MSSVAYQKAAVVAAALLMLVGTSCAGSRPYFASDGGQIEAPLNLDLPAAPQGTPALPATSSDFPLEISVDVALAAWARDRAIPYTDACDRVTPEAGRLCDSPTERATVRLLGPSATDIWYVVTVEESVDVVTGRGYRVDAVTIAGQ